MKTEPTTRFDKWRNSLLTLLVVLPLMSLKSGGQSLSELEQLQIDCKMIKQDLELKELQLEALKRVEYVADSIYNLKDSNEIHPTDTILATIK